MKPTFIQPCFIRKNTPDLRRKLEELGYIKNSPSYTDNEQIIFAYQYSRKPAFDTPHYVIANSFDIPFDGDSSLCDKFIDCGTNEDLFLAVAALREDSDKNQWFCDDIEECKSLFFCEYDDVEKHIHEKMDGWDCEGFHKATVDELIEYFKKD